MGDTSARSLPNRFTAPPGGWRYRVPETGQIFSASNEQELLGQLRAHYGAAGYPMPANLVELIDQNICAQHPDYCVGSGPAPKASGLAHTFTTVLQGTRTIGAWLLGGRELVSQDVADRRASICSMCVQNDEPQGCTSCNSKVMKEAVEKLVGKRSTALHDRLLSCRICGCNLRAKVWFPLRILLDHMPAEQQERLPETCWLKTEGKGA